MTTTTSPAAGRPVTPAGRPFAVVYECPDCEQRFLGERRCPDCNLFTRRIGPGGECPHCEEPVTIDDLASSTAPRR